MAAWVLGMWHALPYSLQVPIAITMLTCIFMATRALDSWVKSLRKDPIARLYYFLLFGGVFAVGVQIIYFAFTWVAAPVQEIWDNYHDFALIPLTAPSPAIPPALIAIIIVLLLTIPAGWVLLQ